MMISILIEVIEFFFQQEDVQGFCPKKEDFEIRWELLGLQVTKSLVHK